MRISALDPIRFLAALLVVLYHFVSTQTNAKLFPVLSELTQFGYLGVPLFFIVSGFVIAISAENRSAIAFVVSRFFRLYPTFWLCVFITMAISIKFAGETYTLIQILSNLTLLNEYVGQQNIDVVYWTLKAELRFYFCIFLLILFKVYEKIRTWLSIWMFLILVYTFTEQPFFLSWFISPGYSSFFIAGVTFYLVRKEGANWFNSLMLVLSLGVSLINGIEQVHDFIPNPSRTDTIIASWLTLTSYIVFFIIATKRFELKKRAIYVVLGGLTYPLYLLHNVAGKAIIDQLSLFMSKGIAIFSVVILMLFISWLIYYVFEKRIINAIKNKTMGFINGRKEQSIFQLQQKHN